MLRFTWRIALAALVLVVGLGEPWAGAQEAPALPDLPAASSSTEATDGDVTRYQAAATRAERLLQAKQYDAAIGAGAAALAAARALGDTREEVFVALSWLANAQASRGDWNAAIAVWKEAFAWRSVHNGPDHWLTRLSEISLEDAERMAALSPEARARVQRARAAIEQGKAQLMAGEAADALEIYRSAKGEIESLLGVETVDYLSIVMMESASLARLGRWEETEPLTRRAVEIAEKLYKAAGPSYGRVLGDLGITLSQRGKVAEAEDVLKQAVAVYFKSGGLTVSGLAAADALNVLWLTRGRPQDLEDAVRLLDGTLQVRKDAFGEGSAEYLSDLVSIGEVLMRQGEAARAHVTLSQAAEEALKAFGPRSLSYGRALSALGYLSYKTGDFNSAQRDLRKAIDIFTALPDAKPRLATAFHRMGMVDDALNRPDSAQWNYDAAQSVRAQLGEPPDPLIVQSAANLAYKRLDYATAERLFRQVLELRETRGDTQSDDYARSLAGLSIVLFQTGRTTEGLDLALKVETLVRETVGREHYDYALALMNVGSGHWRQGNAAAAEEALGRSLEVALKVREGRSVMPTEKGRLAFNREMRMLLDEYLSFMLQERRDPGLAYEAVLAWKGADAVRQRALRTAARAPKAAERAQAYAAAVQRLAAFTVDAPSDPVAWLRTFEELVAQKQRLEVALASDAADGESGESGESGETSWEEVADSLPDEAAMIDFIEFDYMAKGEEQHPVRSMLAFVLRRGQPVEMVRLGEMETVEKWLAAWLSDHGAGAQSQEAAQQLRDLAWAPVEGAVGDATTILISPDAALAQLPFGALPGRAPGSYLLEDLRIAIVPVAHLIPAIAASDPPGGEAEGDILLGGGIDYDAPQAMAATAGADSARAGDLASRAAWETAGPSPLDGRRILGGPWNVLPGARAEADAIAKLYRQAVGGAARTIRELTGAMASEQAFREAAPQSRIIHLATHGFYIPDPRSQGGGPHVVGLPFFYTPRVDLMRQWAPGLLSGVLFAGANVPPAEDAWSDDLGTNDGILTAEELALLPLEGVQLAVLSACESGLGERARGEGVLGIQRACQLAGVRSTITSLWKVDDRMTQQLMTLVYANMLEGKQSPLDALRNAQLEILQALRQDGTGLAEELRGVDGPADAVLGSPYFWAAFTLSGDWR